MFAKALSAATLSSLKKVGESSVVGFAYLAGGTALSLQLGHRISVDLDFFSKDDFNERVVLSDLKKVSGFKEEEVAWKTILGEVDKVSFSLFYYPHKMLEKLDKFKGVMVAGLYDIGAMKLQAIKDRGAKRDFIDLYFLAQIENTEKIFDWYDQKYDNLEEKRYEILRGLAYFGDAEDEAMPQMLKQVSWQEVKEFFKAEVKRLAKKEWKGKI